MILETKDLIIRPSVWEDLDYFYEWEQMPAVTEFFSIPFNQSRQAVVEKYIDDDRDPKAMQFTILLKEGQPEGASECAEYDPVFDEEAEKQLTRPVGRIVLADIEDSWKAEIWRIYIADTALRGKGYGKQAMEAMMGFCFDILDLQRVYLDHYTGNPASGLYLSLGFKYEGVLRQNCRKNGVLYDVHLMSMLRDEYEALFYTEEKE